jgi:hypothetical protein
MSNSTRSIDGLCRRAPTTVRRLAVIMIAAVAFQLNACATQSALNAPPVRMDLILDEIVNRDRVLDSLQTPAVMEYSSPGGHIKAREQITLRRPASLRVEAMSPLGVALVVAADGGQIAVFDPSKNTLMRGPATAETLNRFARIPMPPQQATRLLLALPPDTVMLGFGPSETHDEGDMKVLSYTRPNGVVDDLGFAQGHLALVREKTSAGQLSYEIHYSDYRDIGGMKFPFRIEANFPPTATAVKLTYESPVIDGTIDDSLFVLSPGAKTRQINLGLNVAPIARGTKG